MKKLKVAMVIDKFSVGGGLINIYRLVKNMPDIEFGIFGRKDKYMEFFKDCKNVTIYGDGYKPNYIKSFNPDIIHIHHLKPLLTWFIQSSPPSTPVIFTAHGLHIHKYEFMKGFFQKIKFLTRKKLERFLFKKCSKVVAVSKADKIWLESNYNLSNIVYIPNGIEINSIDQSKKKISLSISKDYFIFITIARFDFQKGYDVLIDAIAYIKSKLPNNVRFILVGNGPLLNEIKNKVKEKKLSEYVLFMGETVDNHSLWSIANAFILPSRWEGLPTVILEAGIYKKLVIASSTYGNTELIREGETGLLFPNENYIELGKKILQVINNYDTLKYLGENLYTLISNEYTIQKCVNQYKSLYRDILKWEG